MFLEFDWTACAMQDLVSLILDDAMFTSAMADFEVTPQLLPCPPNQLADCPRIAHAASKYIWM